MLGRKVARQDRRQGKPQGVPRVESTGTARAGWGKEVGDGSANMFNGGMRNPRSVWVLQPGRVDLDLLQEGEGIELTPVGGSWKGSWKNLYSILQRFRREPPDFLVVTEREFSCFGNHDSWPAGIFRLGRQLIRRPVDALVLCLFAEAVKRNVPIALINRSDNGRLPPGTDWFYRRCHACFVRELHPLPEIALQDLFTPSGGNPQTSRRGRRLVSWIDPGCPKQRDTSKLRPVSLGISSRAFGMISPAREKKWDLFFAGDLEEKGLRGRLLEECRHYGQSRGLRFLLTGRMDYSEYLRTLSESRLSLSPPGMGWDCWRHYESLAAGSVPLMAYPTILQHRPAIDGEHCFYFAPEPGGLTRALDRGFAMQRQLPHLAEAGRRLVHEHHTFPKLREYVIRETMEAFERSRV